jgi:sugar/nucleoside kinase (ribokinase family)
LLSLARETQIIFLNETEASGLLGTEKPAVSLQRLQELGFHNDVVLKLGDRGAVAADLADGRLIEIPALPVKELGLNVISAVGCGDVFVGVFSAYYVTGSSLEQSLIMASAAAGMNATRPETRGSPDRTRLEEVANSSGKLGFTARKRQLF